MTILNGLNKLIGSIPPVKYVNEKINNNEKLTEKRIQFQQSKLNKLFGISTESNTNTDFIGDLNPFTLVSNVIWYNIAKCNGNPTPTFTATNQEPK